MYKAKTFGFKQFDTDVFLDPHSETPQSAIESTLKNAEFVDMKQVFANNSLIITIIYKEVIECPRLNNK